MTRSGGLLRIHAAVLLFGLAGLFGKWLTLPAIIIVLGRVLFAAGSLGVAILLLRRPFRLKQRDDYRSMALLGLLLAIHWYTFFEAIQQSTVGIALLTFSTFPVFTALLEPWFFGERLRLRDLGAGLVALTGVSLVIPEFSLSDQGTIGALWGVASGATFALLSILNRKYAAEYSGDLIAFWQDLSAAVFLLPFLFFYEVTILPSDLGLLVLLGVLFTGLSHSLFISGLRVVRTKTASVITTLEPIYAIMAAGLFLGETPDLKMIAGGSIILGAALYETVTSRTTGLPPG
ncbi:MAG: DMT family transporter [Ignavibacteria bacterium]|nr:DMT family transporter [Ignavibacteria bacterium]